MRHRRICSVRSAAAVALTLAAVLPAGVHGADAHLSGEHTPSAGSVRRGGPAPYLLQLQVGNNSRYGDAVDHAIQVWDAVGGGVKISRAPKGARTDVVFIETNDCGQHTGAYRQGEDTIALNVCKLRGASTRIQQSVAAHELGHALGLPHLGSRDQNLMGFDQLGQFVDPQPVDRQHYLDFRGGYPGSTGGSGRIGTETAVPSSPLGDLNEAQGEARDSIVVTGWTLDPDVPTTPTSVHIYVDGPFGTGRLAQVDDADLDRPDVAAVYPGAGIHHGFAAAVGGISPGPHSLFVYAINLGAGQNALIGSRTVIVPTTPSGSPTGSFDGTIGMARDALWVWGWALDPDAPASPAEVHAYVDTSGGWQSFPAVVANLSRPDVAAAYAGAGDGHGFSTGLRGISSGAHAVALYAGNVGAGTEVLLDVSHVTVPVTAAGSPVGYLDAAQGRAGGTVTVAGWALDPSAASTSSDVHLYVEGTVGAWQGFNLGAAGYPRPDVGAAYPGVGDNHGFAATVSGVSPGPHTAAVYAINIGDGANVLLGSLTVVVPPA